MDTIQKYFPQISQDQALLFQKLKPLYEEWNARINVVSRKDIDELMLRHVLHSLGIAKVIQFKKDARILDIGTGGGFPGIPLAIMFPETQFHLVDSIGKKIKVVNGVSESLGLSNVTASHQRAEKIKGKYDFIVSRAVTQMGTFVNWTKGEISAENHHDLDNGILYLKGGDLREELSAFPKSQLFQLSEYFNEPFFETKKVVYLKR